MVAIVCGCLCHVFGVWHLVFVSFRCSLVLIVGIIVFLNELFIALSECLGVTTISFTLLAFVL